MKKRINNTNFDIDFCKQFNPEKLRQIYSGENPETLDLLIKEVFPEKVESPSVEEKPKAKVKK